MSEKATSKIRSFGLGVPSIKQKSIRNNSQSETKYTSRNKNTLYNSTNFGKGQLVVTNSNLFPRQNNLQIQEQKSEFFDMSEVLDKLNTREIIRIYLFACLK